MRDTSTVRKNLILIPLVLLFIQSCVPAASLTQIPSTPATVEAASSTPAPTPASATLSLSACMQAKGRVEIEDFTTDLLPDPLQYHIYLPPCYDEESDRRYPVLYLIHGKNDTDSQWVNLGVPDTLDRLVLNGELPPFIVVMPRDRVWYEPVADPFGLAVVQSLLPWVDEHYRTLPERKYRAIGGLSRGGAWAIHIGFSHPEQFSAVGLHSSVVFNSDLTDLHEWLKGFPEGMTPRIYMDIGDNDRPEISMQATYVESLLTRYGIPHEWHVSEGGHDADYWKAHVEDYLRWYSRDWAGEPALRNP